MGATALAQGATGATGPMPLHPAQDHIYTFGSGYAGFTVALSNHGTITKLESPAGAEHVRDGLPDLTTREGYVLCYNRDGGSRVTAFDIGYRDSGGFGAATWTSGAGLYMLGRSVRQTSDGKLQLTNEFVWNRQRKLLTVKMKLTNLTGVVLTDVRIDRVIDLDMNGDSADDTWIRSGSGFAALDNDGIGVFAASPGSSGIVEKLGSGAGEVPVFSDSTCGSNGNPPGVMASIMPFKGDGMGKIEWVTPSLPGGGAVVRIVELKRW